MDCQVISEKSFPSTKLNQNQTFTRLFHTIKSCESSSMHNHKNCKFHPKNKKNRASMLFYIKFINHTRIHTPWILLPVTGHLGPLALFLVLWYTNFPPSKHIKLTFLFSFKQNNRKWKMPTLHKNLKEITQGFFTNITRGFNNPVLVWFGGIAVPFAVC